MSLVRGCWDMLPPATSPRDRRFPAAEGAGAAGLPGGPQDEALSPQVSLVTMLQLAGNLELKVWAGSPAGQ